MESGGASFGFAYVAVLVAEVAGDRSAYAIAAMSARFGASPVLRGAIPAFALKALAGVILGSLLLSLPDALLVGVSAATFAASAIAVWRAGADTGTPPVARAQWARGTPLAFASIFLTEWADAGQLATASVVARFHAPWSAWAGASLALATKGVVAALLGARLVRHVPPARLRWMAVGVFVLMAILSVVGRE